MRTPPIPLDEGARLRALLDLNVLDTPPEREFDALAQAAALVCDVPVSLVSLVDADRQWFKAKVGMPGVSETPREVAFCAHAIHQDGIFEVPDASVDPRFAANPLVISGDIRFYAGATLRLADGAHVGTLCVIDREPRQLSQRQREILARLAEAAVRALETRRLARRYVASEARFRALSDAAPLGVFAADVKGACTYSNARWQIIFGLSQAQSLGHGWSRTLHPDDKTDVFSQWQQATAERRDFDMQFRVRDDDGAVRHVRAIGRPVLDEDGAATGYVGSVEDISERVLALKENEDLLGAVREQFVMSITDVHGAIIDVNDAFCAISQHQRDALIGANHRIVNSGHHPRAFFEEMWRCIAAGKSWRGEICNRTRDGSPYWVDCVIVPLRDSAGQIDRYVSLRSDITQRKADQAALLKSEALLSETGTLANVGGWDLELPAGVPRWSDQTCRIHGVAPGYQPQLDEAINFYAPQARSVIKAAVERAIADGTGWDLELPFVQANGNRIWVRAVGHAEFEDGKATRLLGAIQDITQSVRQRQAVEAAHDRLALATESGGIGVWDFDCVEQRMEVDAQMRRLYEVPEGIEIDPMSIFRQRLHPEDAERATRLVENAMQQANGYDHEFRILQRDGAVRHLRTAARVTRDAQGQPLRIVGVNWDVTPLRKLAADLAEQHELLRVTLESIGDAVITTDGLARVSWLNPVAERMTGWLTAEAIGRPIAQVFHIVHEETRQPAADPVSVCLEKEDIAGLPAHTVLISRNGEQFGIEDSAAPIRDAAGTVLGAVLVFHDVTEQRRLSGEMNYRANHDALTGLVNRSEFETRLRRSLNKAHEDRSEHALLFIDLDQFKLVNDACGHSVGDQLLQQMAKLLGETVRARDTLARLGGDEFGVILEHCTSEQALRVAQQICDRMDDFRFVHDGRRYRIGTSIGLVPIDSRWSTPAAAMQAADTSCYAAKEAGRNRVHSWFEADATMRARRGEMRWATRLEEAIDENRFVLYAQKIEALGEAPAGLHAEVLLRLVDDDGRIIAPGAFLPAAERFHLCSRIDRWVLLRSIEALGSLPDLRAVEMLCVNLSGQSIGDRAFHRHAIDALSHAGAELCRHICFEITETAAVTNMADAALFIDQVRALGVRIALDDFGAGASSFGYLKTLTVDLIKIDGQFVKHVLDDPLDAAAVRCFVDVARVIGVKTVAEYVERPEVRQRVIELGIDYAQGFLHHRPEPIEAVLSLFEPANGCVQSLPSG